MAISELPECLYSNIEVVAMGTNTINYTSLHANFWHQNNNNSNTIEYTKSKHDLFPNTQLQIVFLEYMHNVVTEGFA